MNIDSKVKALMPQFFKRIEDGKVYAYDSAGFTRDLSKEMIAKIKEMKDDMAIDNVVAVIDAKFNLCGDIVRMVSYVYIDKEPGGEPYFIDSKNIGFIANVVNDDWDVEEIGEIGLCERVGCVFRTY